MMVTATLTRMRQDGMQREPKVFLQIGKYKWFGNDAVRMLWIVAIAFVAIDVGLICWMLR
jgi:hypothetical protein